MNKKRKDNVKWTRVSGPDLDPNNKKLAKQNQDTLKNEHFVQACNLAGIPSTKRQASKFNNKKGAAYKYGKVSIDRRERQQEDRAMGPQAVASAV